MDATRHFEEFERRDWRGDADGTVRFAMVGVGWWTRDHAVPAVADSDLCETTALVSSSTEKATDAAAELGVEHALTYGEFHGGTAADAYDAVYVCTPNAAHLDVVRTAADLGKAVLCEKPMEASAERAERLVAACEEGDVPLMVAYRMHTDPTIRRARELVREGFVGDPVQVLCHMTQPLLDIIPDPDQWRLNPDLAGPGVSVTDLGIYSINTSRFLLGTDPEAVQAMNWSRHDAFDEVPDERASFQLRFPDGVHAACVASQNAAHHSGLHLIGTEGRIRIDNAFFTSDRTLTVERGDLTADVAVPETDQMREEFDYFADRVLSGEDIEADGEHGLVDMRAIEAVYEAAESGDAVEL